MWDGDRPPVACSKFEGVSPKMIVNLLSSATSLPPHKFSTTELVATLMHKLSPELINTIGTLGVDQRYSTLENYPSYLAGEEMRASVSVTQMSVRAANDC